MKLSKLSQNAKLRNLSVLFVLVFSIGFIIYNFGATLKDLDSLVKTHRIRTLPTANESMSVQSLAIDPWADLIKFKANIPGDVLTRSETISITEKTVLVNDVIIFYRESSQSVNSEVTLLLLHGKNFSSKTWLDLKTISLFTAAGYRTIAIDLPGFGNSEKLPTAMENDKSEFLLHLIAKLEIWKPVIVSPSYSGYYTLPMLVKNWKSFTGFIPVAPVGQEVIESFNSCHHQGTNDHHKIMSEYFNRLPDYFKDQVKSNIPDVSCIQTPTLVIHGEFDRSKSSALLSLLPNARTFEIPQGKHPCYLQNPELFHTLIHNFLLRIIELESK